MIDNFVPRQRKSERLTAMEEKQLARKIRAAEFRARKRSRRPHSGDRPGQAAEARRALRAGEVDGSRARSRPHGRPREDNGIEIKRGARNKLGPRRKRSVGSWHVGSRIIAGP